MAQRSGTGMHWIEETPIAHRGLHGQGVPENSLAAIERAVDHGYAVEIDVRLSSDGVPVVFHDPTLERMTGEATPVNQAPWSRLGSLALAGTESNIPSLQDVLDTVDGREGLLVEIKNHGDPGRLEAKVHEVLAGYDGPFAVQSFNPYAMAWFRKREPEWPRGQVAGSFQGIALEAYKRFLLKRLLLDGVSRPTFVAYEHNALPYWPVTLHRMAGLPVLAWTVRSRSAHDRVRPYADNVIFEGYEP